MDQDTSPYRDIATGARVAPPPAWAELEPYDIPETPNPHFIANGVCVLLDDSQIDLTAPERVWFYRRADMVTALSGAERAAQFDRHCQQCRRGAELECGDERHRLQRQAHAGFRRWLHHGEFAGGNEFHRQRFEQWHALSLRRHRDQHRGRK